MVSFTLARTNLWVHRGRTLLTTAAIALSVSLVVAVTSGYASVENLAMHFVDKYMGSSDMIINRRRDSFVPFDEKLVAMLRADPDVKRVTGRWETENPLLDKDGKKAEGHPAQFVGLSRPEDTRVESLEPKAGKWFDTPDGDVAVIDQVAAERMKVGVGDTFTLPGPEGDLKLKVVGIVQKPQILAEHVQSIYVPLKTMQNFLNPVGITRVLIDLKPGTDAAAFIADWKPKVRQFDPSLAISTGAGNGTLHVARTHDTAVPFDEKIVGLIRADPRVQKAAGQWTAENPLPDEQGKKSDSSPAQLIGMRPPVDPQFAPQALESGGWFDTADAPVAVINQTAAAQMNVKLGETFNLPDASTGPSTPLRVVGILKDAGGTGFHSPVVYLPLVTMQHFMAPPGVNRVMVDLKPGVKTDEFVARWKPKIAAFDSSLAIKEGRDVRDRMDKNLSGLHVLSYLGGTVSMLAATFIIFSALSMGVTERSRTLAMLRAIGASRGQVGSVVIIEGLLLAGVGVAIGTPLGWMWLYILYLKYSHVFPTGVALSWGGILYAAVGSMLAALAASLLPAWWATRVRPLEAMAPSAEPPSRKAPIWSALAGLVLVSIDPLILFTPWTDLLHGANPIQTAQFARLIVHFVVGIPAFMIGFFLLGPAFVVLLEKVASPVVSLVLGLNPGLLRQQLSSGIWRSAGTGAALMVGLAILIAMETQGNSMLKGWELPDRFPDIFIVSWGTPLHEAEIAKLRTVPGIKPNDVLPIAVAAPDLGGANLMALAAAAAFPDSTMFLGLDPTTGMRMMKLDFVQGNEADAIREMNGTYAVVAATDANGKPTGYKLGDSVPVKTRFGVLNCIVAGVVDVSGTGLADLKYFIGNRFDPARDDHISGSKLMNLKFLHGTRADAEALLNAAPAIIITDELSQSHHLNLGDPFPLRSKEGQVNFKIAGVVSAPGMDLINSQFDMGRQFDQRTTGSVFGSLATAQYYFNATDIHLVAADLDANADKDTVMKAVAQKVGELGMVAGDVRGMKQKMTAAFAEVLLVVSAVPFGAMLVASLGVTNTIMASVRTRRWQLGVLRSVGLTRSQLLRLILGESVLIGVVGVAMGIAAAVLMIVDGGQLNRIVTGYHPAIAVPWGIVSIGIGAVLVVATLAGAYPAWSVSRTEPLSLLQSGRAAA
jgi:ABC-type lipoprotein release transport system permease subunit